MSSSQPPLLDNATRELAQFAAETPARDVPPEVLDHIKLSLLDGLGVCLRGTTFPWTTMLRELVQHEGGNAIASLWGAGAKTSLTNAVLVNGTAGHAFELDDIHKESIVHPDSLAMPVALAFAEADPALTGRDIAARMVPAMKWACASAMQPPWPLSPRLPSAGHVRRVRRRGDRRADAELDAGQMQHALGIAGSQAAG